MKPFVFTSPSGDEMVVLPKTEFDRLVAERAEESALGFVSQTRLQALRDGTDIALPEVVSDRLLASENPVLVIREWRDLTQAEVAKAAGISQAYLSDIERGRRMGTPPLYRRLATALHVPVDVILP